MWRCPAGPTVRRSAIASRARNLQRYRNSSTTWPTDYDWRKLEAKLNALAQFITEIDGLKIHFIHVRSPHANTLPLIVTHGWTGIITAERILERTI